MLLGKNKENIENLIVMLQNRDSHNAIPIVIAQLAGAVEYTNYISAVG